MKNFLHILVFLIICHFSVSAQTTLFSDNFDSYSTSQKLAQQATGGWWTTWSGTPGSSEDAAISTEQAHSVSNSTKIISNNDLVLLLGDKTTGRFQVKFYVYVVTGKIGFIGFMQDFAGSNTVFGLSLSFDGTEGSLNIGGNEFIFNYTSNSWLLVNAIIDLDNDFASLFIDGQEKGSGVWSLGSDGTSTILKLDAIDFWGDASGTGSTYYIDDLEYVINYEIPNIAETYVHRIGRTGRAGAIGSAFSFCDAEEKEYLRDVEKLISKKIEVVDNHPFPLIDHNPVKAPKQSQRGRNTGHSRPKPSGNNNSPKRYGKQRTSR